jgi:hypothetical protein
MRCRIAILLLLLTAAAAHAARFPQNAPATTNNADSCDIGPYPAATLLLPYFEVDVTSPQSVARTTLFTVANVSEHARIADVTLWTDFGYPILTFPIFLTGYDLQAINLYDVLVRGTLAAPGGTSSLTRPGELSHANAASRTLAPTASSDCSNIPATLPPEVLADTVSALTTGITAACTARRVGDSHQHAIGYVTIDTVRTCSAILPTDERYFAELIAFENVLVGDSQQIDPDPKSGNFATGNPLVHIRAVPGNDEEPTNLPYTFYDRLTPRNDRRRDRRQPLPAVFAAHWIESGPGRFQTNFQIWRESAAGPATTCADFRNAAHQPLPDFVRFDEHENATGFTIFPTNGPQVPFIPTLPAASSTPTSSDIFPALSGSGDEGGWMYLNLGIGSPAFSAGAGYAMGTSARQSQSWVTVRMAAEGKYATEFDAAALGNGCSRFVGPSVPNYGTGAIGPLPNRTP